MNDTAFWVPSDKTERFTSCSQPEGKERALKLQDDARESIYAEPPKLESGGGGLVSTAHDYLRSCLMMLNGGTLDGVQILSPKTVALFSLNYLPEGREIGDMRCSRCSANPATPGSAFPSAAGSTSTWPEPACPVRSANISGAACRDGLLDRSQGTADRGVHDAGDRQRGTSDLAPRPALLGLLGCCPSVSRHHWSSAVGSSPARPQTLGLIETGKDRQPY